MDERKVDQWLATLPYGLWGDFLIAQPDRRKLAAKWFCQQMAMFNEWLGEQTAKQSNLGGSNENH